MPRRSPTSTKTDPGAPQMDSNAEFRRHSRRLFSVLRAIVRRGADSAGDEREFSARLEGRIGALGRVHEMIMRSPREGIDFEELVHGELLAQAVPPARFRVAGPDTRISADAAMPMALALHELAVNAVIHGAFANAQGSLELTWEHCARDGREWLRVEWQEATTHEQRHPPTMKGFGLELIERSLPYELDACTRVAWSPGGTRIGIEIPGGQPASNWHRDERMPPP
ncbi:MAG TPA: HWE histidine kinase domain-containing protein [Steroidobacteraceae bacterium]|nr:HWE histidine kinase domain-containing protein [Steroidobacteraceae bacterium]